MTKRRPLTEREKAAQAALKRIWDAKKDDLGLTQEMAADKMGYKTQASVHQYLSGRIPLNTTAILRFAKLLRVEPTEIEPDMLLIYPVAGKSAKSPQEPSAVTEFPRNPQMDPAKMARILDEIDQYEAENHVDFNNDQRAHLIRKLYNQPDNVNYRAEIAEVIELSRVLRR